MLLFSLVISAAYGDFNSQAQKLYNGLSCESFTMKFTVTKKQLYTSATYPASNWFTVGNGNENAKNKQCRYELEKVAIDTWYERQKTVWLDFFSEKNYENCDLDIDQDEHGILVNVVVKGRSDKGSKGYTPQTINLSCFYPMNHADIEDLPTAYQTYINGEQTVNNDNTISIKKYGNITTPFELYDVRTNMTERFFPFTQTSRMAKIGQPILVGVWPKPQWKNGKNNNPIYMHAPRWDYFIRDCVFSGLISGVQSDVQLVNRNCKSARYHVQQLSKYGRKNDGHLMMFEAIAFSDADDHFLTCDVDICLKTITGDHAWNNCYRPCDEVQWLSQTDEESPFELTTTLDTPLETTAFPVTTEATTEPPGAHTLFVTMEEPETDNEPTSDILDAKAECLALYANGEDYIANMDESMFTLCQYMQSLFPADFP